MTSRRISHDFLVAMRPRWRGRLVAQLADQMFTQYAETIASVKDEPVPRFEKVQ